MSGLFVRITSAWNRFWFEPSDVIRMHGLRVLVGLLLLAWLAPLAGSHREFFGPSGWFDARAYEEAANLTGGAPMPIGWSPGFLAQSHLAADVLFIVTVASIALFTLGIWTRITGVLTWLGVVAFTQNPAVSAEGDVFLLILSFYLMIGYLLLGRWDSVGAILGNYGPFALFGRSPEAPVERSAIATAMVRLIQVHLAIILLTTGLHKLQISLWWAGVAVWFPLHPPFETTLDSVMALRNSADVVMTLISLATYAVLFWQISFPFLAWRSGWRNLYVAAAVIACLGNWIVYGEPVIGVAVLIAMLAFSPAETWRKATSAVAGRFSQLLAAVRPRSVASNLETASKSAA